jgi:ureidoacrylate peracid hydrolase
MRRDHVVEEQVPEPRVDKSVLLIIDMQNGFCHPDGAFAKLGMDVSMCNAAIEGCRELVDAAHRAGVPVIFTRYILRPDLKDAGYLLHAEKPALIGTKSLVYGAWDAEIVDDLKPEADDFVIDKTRYSAFYGTSLESILGTLGVRNLVVAGVTTNICVDSTVRDASYRDYASFVASDATGELEKDRHEITLRTLGFAFGWVMPRANIVASWRKQRKQREAAERAGSPVVSPG